MTGLANLPSPTPAQTAAVLVGISLMLLVAGIVYIAVRTHRSGETFDDRLALINVLVSALPWHRGGESERQDSARRPPASDPRDEPGSPAKEEPGTSGGHQRGASP